MESDMQIKWSMFVDRKRWASLTPEGRANRSWRPRGEGFNSDPVSPVPDICSLPYQPTLFSILADAPIFGQFSNIISFKALTLLWNCCAFYLWFFLISSFDSPTLPLLSTPHTGLFASLTFSPFPPVWLTPSEPCTMTNPYCCSIGI